MHAFIAMGTQWRSSGLAPTGLDYNALPVVLRIQGVPRAEWRDVFEQIRILEDTALGIMSKHAEQQRQRSRRGG